MKFNIKFIAIIISSLIFIIGTNNLVNAFFFRESHLKLSYNTTTFIADFISNNVYENTTKIFNSSNLDIHQLINSLNSNNMISNITILNNSNKIIFTNNDTQINEILSNNSINTTTNYNEYKDNNYTIKKLLYNKLSEKIGTIYVVTSNNYINNSTSKSYIYLLISFFISVISSFILIWTAFSYIYMIPLNKLINSLENFLNNRTYDKMVHTKNDIICKLFTNFNNYVTQINMQTSKISTLKENEFKYKNVVDNLNVIIFQIDKYGNFIYLNKAWEEKTNNTITKSLESNIFDFVHKNDVLNLKNILKNFINTDLEDIEHIFRILKCNSSVMWVKLKLQKNTISSNIISFFGVLHDMTSTKHYEDQLKEALNNAKTANESKNLFIANVSYEIRNPLNAVTGLSELLLETNLDETQQEFTNIIHESSNSLSELISEILDFSKIDSGKLVLDKTQFDITQLVEESMDILTPKAAEKNIYFMSYIPNSLPLVLGDFKKLKQLLVNLISNAIKFTESGEVIISVSVIDEGQFRILFEIIDTGIGIPKEKISTIFEPFYQIKNNVSTKHNSSGLGLAISKKITSFLNGEIGIISDFNKGSTFWTIIPFEISDNSFTNNNKIIYSKDMNVLLVCDSKKMNYIIHDYLKFQDVKTELITNVTTVSKKTSKKFYNIIILDLIYVTTEAIENCIKSTIEITPFTKIILILNYNSYTKNQLIPISNIVSTILYRPIKYNNLIKSINKLYKQSQEEHKQNITDNSKTSSNNTILVVEDIPANQMLITAQLEQLGYKYICASNGLESVNIYLENTEKISLILMDCQLPELDGYEATEEIRKLEKPLNIHKPIIALTAHALKKDEEKCFSSGMDDYITKPVSLKKLENILDKWLKQKVSNP